MLFDTGDIVSHQAGFEIYTLLVLYKCDTKTETEFWNCLDLRFNKTGIYRLNPKRTVVIAKALESK
jgi:hypothetical protein